MYARVTYVCVRFRVCVCVCVCEKKKETGKAVYSKQILHIPFDSLCPPILFLAVQSADRAYYFERKGVILVSDWSDGFKLE